MSNEYYGVASTPMDDYLAHYGVRGMKWGVRKAIEKGNMGRLDRHFRKASKKLKRLTGRTDKELVQKVKRDAARKSPMQAITGGLASGLGTFAINPELPLSERVKLSAAVGGGMALANGIARGIENLEYRRMLSPKTYNKNVAKRKEFEKEMRKSFKGTKYGRQINRLKADINNEIALYKQMLSDPNDKKTSAKIVNKPNTKNLSRKDQQDVNKALQNWANAFESHYQTARAKGMTHEQAERYSNNYIAKNGFGSVSSSTGKRKRR